MSNTIETWNTVRSLEAVLQQRGVKAGKAFRRHCAALRYASRCRDLDVIREEAAKNIVVEI